MNGVLALVAATVVAIDVGWQPLPDGGFEYIIQLEPQTLESLKDGQDLSSQLPPSLQGVRTYRITVGNNPLPHEGDPPPVPASTAAVAKVPAPAGGNTTFQVPPPPVADLPMDPVLPPGTPMNMRQPGIAAGAPSAAPPIGSTAPGTLPGLPPPPADNTVPPISSDPNRPPAAVPQYEPPATPQYEPPPTPQYEPPTTSRPTLGAGVNEAPPRGNRYRDNPAPASGSDSSSLPPGGFSYPGAPPSIGTPRKNEPPAAVQTTNAPAPAEAKKGTAAAAGATSDPPPHDPPGDSKTTQERAPWLPLIGTLLALFASLGANVYLGWNTVALRSQYRSLVAQLHSS